MNHALNVIRLDYSEKEFSAAFHDDTGRRAADQLEMCCSFPTYPTWEAVAHHEIERVQIFMSRPYILEMTVDPGT